MWHAVTFFYNAGLPPTLPRHKSSRHDPLVILAMRQTWLRTNTRALTLATVLPAAVLAFGLVLAAGCIPRLDQFWLRVVGGVLAAAGAAAVLLLLAQLRQPRVAYQTGRLLIYLRGGGPIRVPIDVVEGFLLGQGPSWLTGTKHATAETANIVIRLSERAEEWARRDVKPALGNWCNHYVTIRGTWCEPLSVPLVNRLNKLLAEAHTSARQEAAL